MNGGGTAPTSLKLLFFLRSVTYLVVFEGLLRAMLDRGHRVHVALDHESGQPDPDIADLLAALRERDGFTDQELPRRRDLWRIPASAVRRSLDYLRLLEPEHADAGTRRDEARERAPRALRVLLVLPPFRWPAGRRALAWLLRRLEASMPIPLQSRSLIRMEAPDVALVSPLLEPGSMQGDHLRSAQARRVPTVLVVASHEDLSANGGIRDVTTLTVVRDQTEVEDAVHLQGIRRDRIEAVGSQGADGALGADAVEAIERAAGGEPAAMKQGRILMPLLWLLTPVLAIVLPFVRPLATARAVARAVRRFVASTRKRARAWRRRMREAQRARRKARVRAAKERKIGEAQAVNEQKRARAETKEQKSAQAESARQAKLARATAPGDKPATEREAESETGKEGQ